MRNKYRKSATVRAARGCKNQGFSGRKPARDLAPTCPDHLVSLWALKAEIQPCSLTSVMKHFQNKIKNKSKQEVRQTSKTKSNKTWNNDFSGIPWKLGPLDHVCVKEHEKLYRSHRSRGLYDQMAPQLCHFYVPGKPSRKTFCKRHGLVGLESPTG